MPQKEIEATWAKRLFHEPIPYENAAINELEELKTHIDQTIKKYRKPQLEAQPVPMADVKQLHERLRLSELEREQQNAKMKVMEQEILGLKLQMRRLKY